MQCWPFILGSTGIAFVLGYIYLFIMRYLGGMIIWLMIFLTEAALLAGGGFCWYLRSDKYTVEDQPTYDYLAYASYTMWALGGLMFLFMLCCCSAIKIGIAVMKATSQFVAKNMRILLLPLISYVFMTVWGMLWFFGGLYLYTVGYAHPRDGFEFSTEIAWD